jgi:hypothetical protein
MNALKRKWSGKAMTVLLLLMFAIFTAGNCFAGETCASSRDISGWVGLLLFHLSLTALALLYFIFYGNRVHQARLVISQSRKAPFIVGLCYLVASLILFFTVQRTIPDAQGIVGAILLIGLLAAHVRGMAALDIEVGERLFMKAASPLTDNGPLCLVTGAITLGLASTFPIVGWLFGIWLGCVAMGTTIMSFRSNAAE